jgi:tetratricopeptide (TPR) repeat protein
VDNEARLVDAAIERYERALDARDAGDDAAALELLVKALGELDALASDDAAVARARISISRAEIATRLASPEQALELGATAVEHSRKVRRIEPMLEASAHYMLGKAERPLRGRRFGAASFDRSLALWRKLEGDESPYTVDAARSLGTACVQMAEWERALPALDLVLARKPDPAHLLARSIVRERLGATSAAREDLDRWLAVAAVRSPEEQVRGRLAVSRLAATTGDAETARDALAAAHVLAAGLPDDPARQASLLEGVAWVYAHSDPPWFLAAEVVMRRAAASMFSPPIADTAWRIATIWRYGVAEDLVQPAFAVLDVEAALQEWDPETLSYRARSGHQRVQLVVGGAPTSIERLADSRWCELCVQRMFSTFHAEQFKGHEPKFVAPVKVTTLRLPPEHVLELLPSLRVPKWATTSTVMISSLGEVELTGIADLAVLATRAMPADAAIAAVQKALPSLGKDVAREMLAAPRDITLAPTETIPLLPGS